MRDAAFEIALRRDDWAPSLGRRLADAVASLFAAVLGRRRAAADLAVLRGLSAAHLADVGLAPHDLVGLDGDPLAATRTLAARARMRRADLADRWAKPTL